MRKSFSMTHAPYAVEKNWQPISSTSMKVTYGVLSYFHKLFSSYFQKCHVAKINTWVVELQNTTRVDLSRSEY